MDSMISLTSDTKQALVVLEHFLRIQIVKFPLGRTEKVLFPVENDVHIIVEVFNQVVKVLVQVCFVETGYENRTF